jgi:outer membrane assembly lipoprotein YfgL
MMRAVLAGLLLPLALLAGCSTGSPRPKPLELQAFKPTLAPRLAWSVRLSAVDFPISLHAASNSVTLAASDGTVLELDAATGREIWRLALGSPLAAGVGSDGTQAAVVTRDNQLVAIGRGKVLWRQPLAAQAFSAPLVAGGRVFLLTADRAVSAYDGASGRRLWVQQRPGGEPLVLRQSGVMLPVGDTLLVGLGGRLSGLNPLNGSARWDAPIATPRGINEIERLVDLVGPASRQAKLVCVRAFQAAVACVDTDRGAVQWSRQADGQVGLASDDRLLFGAEADGLVQAWRLADGEKAWSHEQLRFRDLTAPVVVGRSVALGDLQGHVHLLSRDDGSVLARMSTDGSAIAAQPVLVGQTLIVATRSGGVFGFVPQ